MTIRPARPDDALSFGPAFEDAVRVSGPEAYSAEQVEAWALASADRSGFNRRVLSWTAFVAEDESGTVGFASLGRGGHIAMLYVRPDRQRRGICSALLDTLIGQARANGAARLRAEASAFSLPVFVRAGFHITATETVERVGVLIERVLVERSVEAGRGGP